MAPKRALTGYQTYSNLHREDVLEQLRSEQDDSSVKIGVAAAAKVLGAQWKALSKEEQDEYKERGKADFEAQRAEGGGDQEDDKPAPKAAKLPAATVKKIITADAEITRVSKEGVSFIAQAAELYLASLAVQAMDQARGKKRSTLKVEDLADAAGSSKRHKGTPMFEVLTQQGGGGGPSKPLSPVQQDIVQEGSDEEEDGED